MNRVVALLLSLACVSAHAEVQSPAVDNERLMRALENLQTQVQSKADGLEVARGARLTSEMFLTGAGLALVATYAVHQLPLEIVRRALVKNIRWAAILGTSSLAVSGATWFGAHVFNAYMQDAYAQWVKDDRDIYQTKKGLTYFFQLPIDEQFLYARQHPEFSEFLISLSDSFDLLNEGFLNPQRPPVPLPR